MKTMAKKRPFNQTFDSIRINAKIAQFRRGLMMTKPEKPQASTRRRYKITQEDLPLSCPMPEDRLWDAHPRVYLPIESEGHFVCPYCEAEYILKDFKKFKEKAET